MEVKQIHCLLPWEVQAILNFMAYEYKGEYAFKILDQEDQMDVISMLCDNPSEWYSKAKEYFDGDLKAGCNT